MRRQANTAIASRNLSWYGIGFLSLSSPEIKLTYAHNTKSSLTFRLHVRAKHNKKIRINDQKQQKVIYDPSSTKPCDHATYKLKGNVLHVIVCFSSIYMKKKKNIMEDFFLISVIVLHCVFVFTSCSCQRDDFN